MKRLLQIVLLLAGLAWCVPAHAQCSSTSYGAGWTCIQATESFAAGSGTTQTATLGANVATGHMLHVYTSACNDTSCATDGSFTVSISGTAPDTCEQDGGTPVNTAGHVRFYVFACPTNASGTTVIATCSGTCWFLGVYTGEWAGAISSGYFDGNGAASSGTGTSSTVTETVGTTSNLFLCSVGLGAANAVTPGAGFTEIGEISAGKEHEARTGVSGSQAGTTSWTGSTTWSAYCSDFHPPSCRRSLMGVGC